MKRKRRTKLWQEITLVLGVMLLLLGIILGICLLGFYQKRQIEHVKAQETESFEKTAALLEDFYASRIERYSEEEILESLFYQRFLNGYVLMEGDKVRYDRADYRIKVSAEWESQGRFERAECFEQTVGDRKLLSVGSRLSWLEGQPYLFMITDITEIYQETVLFLRDIVFLWCLFMVLLLVVIAVVVKRMLAPLGKLEEAARSYGTDQETCLPEKRKDNEIGSLTEAFGQMQKKITAQIEELEATNARQKQLIGNITHEIRTPMTGIVGYSDALLHLKLSETQKERALLQIHDQALHLQKMSGKLMELTGLYRNEAIEKMPCCGEELFAEAICAAEESYPSLQFKITQKTPLPFEGDPELFLCLVRNLLENAAKASSEGGRIEVEILPEHAFRVRDYGKGMTKEQQARIFEPFYQADTSRKKGNGLGLGLALCMEIVRLHGWQLAVESEEGKGTTFTVCLQTDEDLKTAEPL